MQAPEAGGRHTLHQLPGSSKPLAPSSVECDNSTYTSQVLEASCATMEVVESQETIVSVVPTHHAGLGSLSGGCGTHRVREMGPAPAPSAPRPVPVRAGGSPGPAAGAGLAAAQGSAESPAACSGTEAGLAEIPRGSLLLAEGRGAVRHPLGSQKYGMGGMSQVPQQHAPHVHTSHSLTCFCGWLL